MDLVGATCDMRERDDSESGFHICGADATHVAIMPWGAKKLVCETHAAGLAGREGILVRPAIDICSECGAINKSREVSLYCWCGANEGIERVNVEGVWYALCAVHRPPPLWSLWKRWLLRVAGVFRRPPKTNEAEIIRLTLEAKQKARRR